MPATWAPDRARRPWVQRTALGIPVDPDVNTSRYRSSSATSAAGSDEAGRGGQLVGVVVGVHQQHTVGGQRRLDAGQELGVGGGGHQQLAVGVVDQLGQRLTPVGGVDPHHHRSGQRRGHQPEQVVGGVVQEDPDVGRAAGIVARVEHRGPSPTFRHHLRERPAAVLVQEPRPLVVLPGQEQIGDRGHARPGVDIGVSLGSLPAYAGWLPARPRCSSPTAAASFPPPPQLVPGTRACSTAVRSVRCWSGWSTTPTRSCRGS